MAQSKNTKSAPTARIAHKLARYVRASPTHIPARLSQESPSTTHLSISLFIQPMEDLNTRDLEITLTLGTLLTINQNHIKGKVTLLNHPLEENLSNQEMS